MALPLSTLRQTNLMARQPASSPAAKTAAPSLSALLKKRPERDTKALLADIAALNGLAGQSRRPEATEKALAWCEVASRRKLDAAGRGLVNFYAAHAWIGRHHERKNTSGAWEQPEIEKAIFHLKKAVDDPAFLFFDELLRCQNLTLLGNQYSYVGDFIHALEYWDRAIETDTSFGMALGNRGKGIAGYAGLIADDSLTPVFLGMALDNLAASIDEDARYYGDEQGREYFRAELEKIEATLTDPGSETALARLSAMRTEKSGKDKGFRKWCLSKKLYLNPYNDLCRVNAAAFDIMEQPGVRPAALSILPPPIRFLSQLRREYIAARRLCHDAVTSRALRGIRKGENLPGETESWQLAVESLKLAYRPAWALLPKIAHIVNGYFDLRLPESRIGLKTVWYKNGHPSEGLADVFSGSANWPLRGLFWLSKSLPSERGSPSLEPRSALLKTLAEELDKRCLRVVELDSPDGQIIGGTLSRRQLEGATLKVLGLARAAIVYLTQAIAFEEAKKTAQKNSRPAASVHSSEPTPVNTAAGS